MSEDALWVTARRHLSPYGLLKRVENRAEDDMPDVVYCLRGVTGWVELKHMPAWPVRKGSPVTISSLQLGQVVWLEQWVKSGGRAWCLLQIGRCYLLLRPSVVREIYHHKLTTQEVMDAATLAALNVFPTTELVKCLSG